MSLFRSSDLNFWAYLNLDTLRETINKMANKRKILVVDDTPLLCQGTAWMLEVLGFEVDQAMSGERAISLFASGSYAGVVMDYHMPQMDGFQCTAEIRRLEQKSGNRTPIICFTASDDDELMRGACLKADLDDYINKDCTQQEFADVVLKWVSPSGITNHM